jgi:hypothetical protein
MQDNPEARPVKNAGHQKGRCYSSAMKMKTWFAVVAVLAMALSGSAQTGQKFQHNADFTMLVEMQSDPPGAEIWSVPSTNEEAVKVGTTPYVALVDLTWKSGWLFKRWHRLSVWTPGNLARADYTPKGEIYDVYLHFTLSKPGYETEEFGELIASFEPPQHLDYDNIDFIPAKKTVHMKLAREGEKKVEPAESGAEPAPVVASKTVMIAGSESRADELGTVHVAANVNGADVLVDGNFAGVTPVKLIVPAGRHDIAVNMPGYQGVTRTMDIRPRRQVVLKVSLSPGAAVEP